MFETTFATGAKKTVTINGFGSRCAGTTENTLFPDGPSTNGRHETAMPAELTETHPVNACGFRLIAYRSGPHWQLPRSTHP